jgi:hypothetical protein
MSLTVNDLEQINKIVTGVVNNSVNSSESRMMKHMDTRFDEMTLATAELIDGVLVHMDERFAAVDERFAAVDEHFESLEGEVRATNRIVRKHSLDIMKLRASA